MNDVTGDVIAIIAKRKRADKPTVELSDRLDDLGVESLDAVELIFDLEEKFNVEIPFNANTSNTQTKFETVGDIVKSIQQLLDKKT